MDNLEAHASLSLATAASYLPGSEEFVDLRASTSSFKDSIVASMREEWRRIRKGAQKFARASYRSASEENSKHSITPNREAGIGSQVGGKGDNR
jgi:hypothetical protein